MYKILIVDDVISNIRLVQAILEPFGYEVIEAHSGHEAIIKAKDELPNLIFMDINMPEMDGVESMNRIKEVPILINVPVIAYTANAMNGDREKLLVEGFDEYLSKPISTAGLIGTVKKHLALR